MAKASTQPRPSWEQLSDSSQRIYLALAEGDQQRARQLYQQDQPPRRRQRRRAPRVQPTAAPKAAARDLPGFVVRGRRWEPQEMADAEAWKLIAARTGEPLSPDLTGRQEQDGATAGRHASASNSIANLANRA